MFAILDIETTGLSPAREKITEIAIYIHDGEKIVDEFATLLHPERSIPSDITRLTGIDNRMVENAPKFFEVAKKIVEITDGATIVAHNANFDYGFIQAEFRRLGYEFSRKLLCTVKLSRKLMPGFRSYGLGKICAYLGIENGSRHRAAGDAFATVKLFEHLISVNNGTEDLFSEISALAFKDLNPLLKKSTIDALPAKTGVYYFYNEKGDIIYIGKSKDIKKRVATHLRNTKSVKASQMRQEICDVSYELTGSELIALLLESEEIKKHKPIFNRRLRRSVFNTGIYHFYDKKGYLNFRLNKKNNAEIPLSTFTSKQSAKSFLENLVLKFNLCQKLSDLYKSETSCFHYNIKMCNGACIGKEPTDEYNKRALEAVKSMEYKHRNFIVIDKGRDENEGR
jgi:DNA polymerase-3 subunit epsilon